jgi:DNA-directed RNA polymerase specialized sigma24 family protein
LQVSAHQQAGQPAGQPAPLQPASARSGKSHPGKPLSGRSGPVSADEIAEGLDAVEAEEARQAEERLQRRLADRELLDRLSDACFQGDEYDAFADDLARYAIPVLRGWMYTGFIFSVTAKRGYRLEPSEAELHELRRDSALRGDLAMMTVAKALPFFRRRALLAGGWTVDGGASLTTYFTGACVFNFPNEFRQHRRARQQRFRVQRDYESSVISSIAAAAAAAQDPATLVASNLRVEDCLGRLDDRARTIVELSMDGYTQAEIVEMLGETSVRGVEGVMYRFRTEEKARMKRREER